MFYCDDCAKENGYPETIMKSQGPCECCGKVALCNDMPSSKLPKPKDIFSDLAGSALFPDFQPKSLGLDESPFPKREILFGAEVTTPTERNKYPIIDVPANGKPNWMEGARSMFFVYSKKHGNFILRGFRGEVEKYLKQHYSHYFYYVSMWSGGRTRGHWKFWKERVYIDAPCRSKRHSERRNKWTVHKFGEGGNYRDFSELKKEKEVTLEFKRLPKRWIPEFDAL
jgi:hypothetical protein